MPQRARSAALPLLFSLVLAMPLLAGCGADPWDEPGPEPSPVGTPGPGFLPAGTPAPEATLTPAAGSWEGVHPASGYRVVLLTAGDDEATAALVSAVRDWAAQERVDLRTVTAGDHLIDAIVEAMDLNPDLIVSAGNALVDPLTTVSANHLDRQFLVVGAELAEPTHNVTAVDWTGAAYRGEELGMPSAYDSASFTPERCAAAIRAGVAAVLTGLTGVVLWIP